jgi:hypothetical protein
MCAGTKPLGGIGSCLAAGGGNTSLILTKDIAEVAAAAFAEKLCDKEPTSYESLVEMSKECWQ